MLDLLAGPESLAARLEGLGMQEFISRENIRNFQAQLEGCTDEEQRATLLKLLQDEERRLAAIMSKRAAGTERSTA